MSIETAVRPRWLATAQDDTDLRARCISPCEGAWMLDRVHDDFELRNRVNLELSAVEAKSAYVLQPGSESTSEIATSNTIWRSLSLNGIDLRFCDDPVDGLWLAQQETVVTRLTGEPFLLARGGGFTLALRFGSSSMGFIADKFMDRGIDKANVVVRALFGRPRTEESDYYKQIEVACKRIGMKAHCERRLPAEGKFGYNEHPTLQSPNLGIFTRLR